MVAQNSNRKEIIALLSVVVVIAGLVGFVTLGSTENYDFETTDPVDTTPEEIATVPDREAELREQRTREAKGLPTKEGFSTSGRSHLHGGYGATFRVVDRASNTGVSNAVVYFLPQKAASEIDWKWRKQEIVRRQGKKLRADHWGDVRIQNFIGSALVVCEHDGGYGELYIKSFYEVMKTKQELFLDKDQAVKIQVINGKGRGVSGVPVALWRDNAEAHKDTNGRAPRRILIWTGKTWGPNGIALARRTVGKKTSKFAKDDEWDAPIISQLEQGGVFASFYFPPLMPQSLFEELSQSHRNKTLNDASGNTRHLLEQVHEVKLTAEGAIVRPLELPETGTVKLTLRNDDGSHYKKPCVVWIGAFMGERGQGPGHSSRAKDFDPDLKSISNGSIPFTANRGVVTLPHVGLFSEFNITVMPMDQTHDAVSMVVVGPTRGGQIKPIDVPLGPERAQIHAKIKNHDGSWHAGKYLDVSLAIPGVNINGLATKHKRVKTDDEGGFSVRVPVEFSHYGKLEIRILSMRRGTLINPPYTSMVINTPEAAGEANLGVLTLASRGLICRGRILDDKNRPLANASITIYRDPFGEHGGRAAGDSRIYAMTRASDGPEIVAEIQSNKQGYFTYGGYLESGDWELEISHEEKNVLRSTRLEFAPGTKNMVINVGITEANN